MLARTLFGFGLVSAIALMSATDASADAPAPFGPVSNRAFYIKAGTSVERAGPKCNYNVEWLFINGAGLANAKSVDITPRLPSWSRNGIPSSACSGPDCLQVMIKIGNREPVGPRTVTIKAADGRTVTTTFDVVENAGRCDYGEK